jgi:hypothetical protein
MEKKDLLGVRTGAISMEKKDLLGAPKNTQNRAISMEKKDLLGVRTKPVTAPAGVGGGGRRLAKAIADYLMYARWFPTLSSSSRRPRLLLPQLLLVSCRFLVSFQTNGTPALNSSLGTFQRLIPVLAW